MADITCEVRPRKDLTSPQLKSLGEALATWCEREQEAGLGALYATQGVGDLLEGELPQPLALRQASRKPEPIEDEDPETVLKEVKRRAKLEPEELERLETEERALTPGSVQRAKQGLGPLASSRAILLSVADGSVCAERERVVSGLKNYIPEELVEDILVDGRSWRSS